MPQELAEAKNGGQHVVEIVCNPAGEPTHGLEPQALLQMLLRATPLGKIEHDAGQIERLARGRLEGAPSDRHDRVDAAVGPNHPVLRREGGALSHGALPTLSGELAVLRVECLQPGCVRYGRVREEPEQCLAALIPVDLASCELVLPG